MSFNADPRNRRTRAASPFSEKVEPAANPCVDETIKGDSLFVGLSQLPQGAVYCHASRYRGGFLAPSIARDDRPRPARCCLRRRVRVRTRDHANRLHQGGEQLLPQVTTASAAGTPPRRQRRRFPLRALPPSSDSAVQHSSTRIAGYTSLDLAVTACNKAGIKVCNAISHKDCDDKVNAPPLPRRRRPPPRHRHPAAAPACLPLTRFPQPGHVLHLQGRHVHHAEVDLQVVHLQAEGLRRREAEHGGRGRAAAARTDHWLRRHAQRLLLPPGHLLQQQQPLPGREEVRQLQDARRGREGATRRARSCVVPSR